MLNSDKTLIDTTKENDYHAESFKTHYRLGIAQLRAVLDSGGLLDIGVDVVWREDETWR